MLDMNNIGVGRKRPCYWETTANTRNIVRGAVYQCMGGCVGWAWPRTVVRVTSTRADVIIAIESELSLLKERASGGY